MIQGIANGKRASLFVLEAGSSTSSVVMQIVNIEPRSLYSCKDFLGGSWCNLIHLEIVPSKCLKCHNMLNNLYIYDLQNVM